MAFPWKLIRGSILATGHLTEDLKLAIDLSLQGFPPLYCPDARCDSTFPESENAMTTQRTRWQHGYFSSIVEYTPKLAAAALRRADWRLLAVAIDLSVPPLALMFMVTALMSFLACAAFLLGAGSVLAGTSLALFPGFILLILITWRFHGRDIVSGADLVKSLNQLIARISMLRNFITKPQRSWVRTERKEDR
jgi:cellulose synthase/poly-beta-1,6-N-acetylglucosamine synthase-like glycosyltransferase